MRGCISSSDVLHPKFTQNLCNQFLQVPKLVAAPLLHFSKVSNLTAQAVRQPVTSAGQGGCPRKMTSITPYSTFISSSFKLMKLVI